MSKHLHCAISVDIDRWSDEKLRREWLPAFAKLGVTTVQGLRDLCATYRSKGYEVFPSCDKPGPTGLCIGHTDEEIAIEEQRANARKVPGVGGAR